MKTKRLFRIASWGLLIAALVLFDYSSYSFESNGNIYVVIFISILLWVAPNLISSRTNIKISLLYLNGLIVFLILFVLFNLVLILRNPENIRPFGWIFVSICFIIGFFIIKKENIKKLRN